MTVFESLFTAVLGGWCQNSQSSFSRVFSLLWFVFHVWLQSRRRKRTALRISVVGLALLSRGGSGGSALINIREFFQATINLLVFVWVPHVIEQSLLPEYVLDKVSF